MSERKTTLDPRYIEYDGLALAMFALAFVLITAAASLIIGNAAQVMDARVIGAGGVIAAGVIGAWIFGYPRHAAMPSVALAVMGAVLVLPLVFDMNGALLREAVGTPASRLYVAMGLYVGGLGLIFLAFVVFGFVGPLVGALLRLKRGEADGRATVKLHLLLCGAATALTLGTRLLL